jgi:hypothetical protein
LLYRLFFNTSWIVFTSTNFVTFGRGNCVINLRDWRHLIVCVQLSDRNRGFDISTSFLCYFCSALRGQENVPCLGVYLAIVYFMHGYNSYNSFGGGSVCFVLVMRDKNVAAYRKHPVIWCFISSGFLCVFHMLLVCVSYYCWCRGRPSLVYWFIILSRVWVTIDGVWVRNWIYWAFTERNYK